MNRAESVRFFLPLSATANRPPPPGGVPIQLKRQWMMLLGLPEHVAKDDTLVEQAINRFAALVRVDRSHAPVVAGVTRVVLETLIADVKEVPHVLTVIFDDGPLRMEVDVGVHLLCPASESAGQDGAASGGGGSGGGEAVLRGSKGDGGNKAEASGEDGAGGAASGGSGGGGGGGEAVLGGSKGG